MWVLGITAALFASETRLFQSYLPAPQTTAAQVSLPEDELAALHHDWVGKSDSGQSYAAVCSDPHPALSAVVVNNACRGYLCPTSFVTFKVSALHSQWTLFCVFSRQCVLTYNGLTVCLHAS